MRRLTYLGIASAFVACGTVFAGVPSIQINEIRIDQFGTDFDEYFELVGPPSASLDGLTYIVIGDKGSGDPANSGVIEAVVPLSGNSMNVSGFFLVAETPSNPNVHVLPALDNADLTFPDTDNVLNFENSDNVTHLLVQDYVPRTCSAGLVGSPCVDDSDCNTPPDGVDGVCNNDLDTNDDGVLDILPWTAIVDSVGVIEEPNPPTSTEYHYGAVAVGPDVPFVPGHVYRCSPQGAWIIGEFDAVIGVDSPGAANPDCACGDAGSGNCFQDNGTPYCEIESCCDAVCVGGFAYCCDTEWDAGCAAQAAAVCTVPGPAPEIVINEIRTGQGGADNDEYFELAGGIPFTTSLDGVSYIVIGDGIGANEGVIESVTVLSGNLFFSNYFLVAEDTFTLGTEDVTANLNFEDSDNVTHLLVFNFTGNDGDDLDTNDDGVLDVLPWESIIDSVAIVGANTPGVDGDHIYSADTVGPDGIFTPGHVYRCGDSLNPADWTVGEFNVEDAGSVDTPGAMNQACGFVPPCGAENAGSCLEPNGTPHCDDLACCELVEGLDPGCATAWDADCAATAALECYGCGDAETGDCFTANGSPYCNLADCCDAVCGTGGFEFCCTSGWDAACADLAANICTQEEVVQQDDVVHGLSNGDGLLTMELIRGPAAPLGGVQIPDPWDEAFMQSMEFDNLDGISHNNQGNLLGLNFGAGGGSGTIHSFATCVPTSTDQLIGDTEGLGGDGLAITRLGGLSISPGNTKIAVVGYDSGAIIVYDYTPGNCEGAGASLSGGRQTSAAPLFVEDTQGSAWLDDDTVIGFSTSGEIFTVNASNMEVTLEITVNTVEGGGPGFTDIEYNPEVSPHIYAMYSAFSGTTTNLLFVLDDNFTLLGTFDFSTSMNTSREISFDSQGNLFVGQFIPSVGAVAIDFIPDAADWTMIVNNMSVDYYSATTASSFPGLDVAKALGGSPCPACAADLNEDTVVNAADLAQLLGAWGMPGCSGAMPCCANLNGDGAVNAADLAQLLGAWGPCP